jgi:hypothetical protein
LSYNKPWAHSWFDSKIIHLYALFYMSYFPYDGHNGTHSCKSNGRDLEFRGTFSQFVLEKSEGNFIFTRKFKRCYNINFFLQIMGKICVIFIECCM